MYCPDCSRSYSDDVDVCPDCGVELAAGSAELARGDGPLVEVYRSADASLLPVIESVLMGAGIDFLVQGEEGQALFPLGALGGGPDERFLGAVVKVREEDAEQALEALDELPDSGEDE